MTPVRETMGDQEGKTEAEDEEGGVPPTGKDRWLNVRGGQKGVRKILHESPELEVPGDQVDPEKGGMKMIGSLEIGTGERRPQDRSVATMKGEKSTSLSRPHWQDQE